jgi:hypothetical protein
MAFVYQRKNVARPGADACETACKRHACNLQECLARLPVSASSMRMDHTKCAQYMERWNVCCDAVKAAAAGKAEGGSGAAPQQQPR